MGLFEICQSLLLRGEDEEVRRGQEGPRHRGRWGFFQILVNLGEEKRGNPARNRRREQLAYGRAPSINPGSIRNSKQEEPLRGHSKPGRKEKC